VCIEVATNDKRTRWEGVSKDKVKIGFVFNDVVVEVDNGDGRGSV
jgi:hypothetical protein